MRLRSKLIPLLLAITVALAARAEDGYRLWLRYDALPAETAAGYRAHVACVVVEGRSATLDAIREELVGGLSGLRVEPLERAGDPLRDGALVVGTPTSSAYIAKLNLGRELKEVGAEGFVI